MGRFANLVGLLSAGFWLAVGSSALGQLNPAAYTFVDYAGRPQHSSADGPADAAQFDGPVGATADRSGNLYIADTNNHTIRKISAAGVVSTLAGAPGIPGSADGVGAAARFKSPQGVAVDANGTLYVADTGNRTIRKITAGGVVSTMAGSVGVFGETDGIGTAALFTIPDAVTVDGMGNIYVADGYFGIRKITPAGVVTTLAHLLTYGGVAADAAGNVYVAAENFITNTVYKISPDGVMTTLAVTHGPPGPLIPTFLYPSGVAADPNGNVYETDGSNGVILKITPAGVVVTIAGTIPTNGVFGSGGGFGDVEGLALEANGNLVIVHTSNNTIGQIAPDGTVTRLAGLTGSAGNADGVGRIAQFNWPLGLAVDGSGNLFVADNDNNEIRKIAPGGVVTTLAGAYGTASAGQFNSPYAVAADPNGNVYVADTDNDVIRVVNPAGAVRTFAGSVGIVGAADGTIRDARFNRPSGLAVDLQGNVYVADTDNRTIRKISADGQVTTVAGSAGLQGAADGPGSVAQFGQPIGIAVDLAGNLYVADELNDTIRKITANGVVTTLAGMAGVAGSDDGVGSSARFWYPYGVAVDSGGNVFVADSNNYVIRKITPDGSVTTIGGTVRQVGSMDGVGSNASFGPVSGIAVDAGGNVYVADNSNSEIRVGSAGEPVITSDPQGAVITYGVGGTLSATAQGAITYQWCLNGTPIAGATADSYVATYGGNYTMSASNAAGSALSGIAVVTADSRLTNLSTRIQVGTGGNAAISGLVIAGLPGSTKQLLIRAVGPALAQFGLTGELVQPSLSVFDSSGGLIASNSAWGTPPVPGVAAGGVVVQLPTPTLMKAVGAFALPSGSADSAMVVTLPPGAYTAEISGVGGTTGLALAEIYEMNASDSAVLSNISTRADAGVGQNAAVGGFAVVGTQPATLLIRAIGPALSGFGVTGFLSQPALTVFDSRGAVIAMDLGWGVAPSGGDSTVNSSIQAATSGWMLMAGAFPLSAGSADSALVLTLPPGAYTAEVSAGDGVPGVALVEIYQVQ